MSKVNAKPRPTPSDKEECLENWMGKLEAASMVLPNPQAACASIAMAVVPTAGDMVFRVSLEVRGTRRWS